MACRVRISKIPAAQLEKLKKTCTFKLDPIRIGARVSKFRKQIKCWRIYDDYIYFPKRFDQSVAKWADPEYDYTTVKKKPHPTKLYDGNDQLDLPPDRRRDQVQVYEELVQKLKDYGSALLSASTSYGKTLIAVHLAILCGLKPMVICNSVKVRDQWVAEFRKAGYCVQTSGVPLSDYDAFVYGPQAISKMNSDDLKDVGFLIMDEIHTYTESSVTNVMLRVCPRFLLGLSATPDRKGGLDRAFPFYYGDKSDWITRILKKDFVTFRLDTDITPGELPKPNGFVAHKTLMGDIYENEDLYSIIHRIVKNLGDRRCMVVFELVEKGVDKMAKYLDDVGFKDYYRYCGNESKYVKKKVLVTTDKKSCTGFDDPDISVLIFAHSTLDIRQAEGRARGNNYFIFDLVHNRGNLDRHADDRKHWYIFRGGIYVHLHHTDIEKIIVDVDEKGEWLGMREENEVENAPAEPEAAPSEISSAPEEIVSKTSRFENNRDSYQDGPVIQPARKRGAKMEW